MPTRERRAKMLSIPVDQLPDGRGKHGNHVKGEKHHRWNTSRLISSHGYVKVRVGTEHPLADPNGYAYEHLLVWVSTGKTLPAPGELLHHRNENRRDNRLDNLALMPRPDHNRHHNEGRVRDERGRFT